ncbi:hypothetical protein [Streptomyces sp. CAU 1734]
MDFRRATAAVSVLLASAVVLVGMGSQAHAESAGDKKVEVIKAVVIPGE